MKMKVKQIDEIINMVFQWINDMDEEKTMSEISLKDLNILWEKIYKNQKGDIVK